MTFRLRLALWYAGLLTLIIIIFGVIVFGSVRLAMLNSFDMKLQQTATQVIQNIRFLPPSASDNSPAQPQLFFRSDEVFRIPGFSTQVWLLPGNEGSSALLLRASPDLIGFRTPLNGADINNTQENYESVVINDTSLRVTTRPFYNTSNGEQLGVVQVATDLETFHGALRILLLVLAVTGTIAIAVSVPLGMWISSRLLQPIQRMKEAASNIAETEDLATRLCWEGPDDEIGQLTRVFNRMMERLEYLFQVQQRFVGDVSHELRTPLTAIHGNVEVIQKYGADDESLQAICCETERMTRMVNDLLLLTRADYGAMKVDFHEFELDQVLLGVHERTYAMAKERDLNITLGKLETALVYGNPNRVHQMITNLVVNAIKFTPDGGMVTLSLHCEDDMAVIKVEDTGIGISEADQKQIFDRFFQVDDARTHHHDEDGAGLGLSIAKWIAQSHGGCIEVESILGIGTTFSIYLPLVQSTPMLHVRNGDEILSGEQHAL